MIKIQIKNIDKIQRVFQQAPIRLTKELNTAIEKILLKLENSAKRNAPVNKQSGGGNLRQSIRSQMTGPARGIVEATADYAAAVHEGTRPHLIKVKTKKVLANRRSGEVFGRVVRHPGTKANPFLQNAIDQNKEFIDQQMEKAIDNTLK